VQNDGHRAVRRLQEFCAERASVLGEKGPKSMLVTQNIDDFHCKEVRNSEVLKKSSIAEVEGSHKNPIVFNDAFTSFVYEIHGNIAYMHCSNEDPEDKNHHSRKIFKIPSFAEHTKYHEMTGKYLVP